MTTIKKYFAPVLVLSAALLLLSCGKDDNGNGGGNGGGEGGDPNPPVPTEKTTVWDSNSLHFAKLFGEVQKVDTLFDGVNTALFDRNGYITSYKIKGYDAANNPVEYAFQCTYNADSLVTSITSDQMTVTFLYGDHGKYIEVEQDIFEYNQLDYLYVFQPRFLKNLTSVVINAQGQRLEFGFEVSGDRMTVKAPDGTVWSETTYAGEFPAQRVTEYSGEEYKTDDEGNYVKEDGQYVKVSYTAVATETFQFNAENGNLLSYQDEVVKTFEDNTTSTSRTQNLYNDDLFNTIAREGNTVYTYDDFGEYIHIESDMLVSDFTMQRDERNNWYDRTETTVLFGDTFTFRDRRNISYYSRPAAKRQIKKRDALRPAFYYSGMIRPSSSTVPIRNGSRFSRKKPYIGHRTRKNADPSLRFGPHRASGDSLAASAASSDIPATSARRRSGISDNRLHTLSYRFSSSICFRFLRMKPLPTEETFHWQRPDRIRNLRAQATASRYGNSGC